MRALPGAQGGDRWLAQRRGRITASSIYKVLSFTTRKSKSGEAGSSSAVRETYKRELAAERVTRHLVNHYQTYAMQHGIETEPIARQFYEMAAQTMVEQVGLVLHPRFDFAGATPDGLVGDDGLLEIKCPTTETFLEWRWSGEIPQEYIYQIQWQLACTERQWCHFYAFDDRIERGPQHILTTVQRDEEIISRLEAGAEQFDAEIEAFLAKCGYPPTEWDIASEMLSDPPPEVPESVPYDHSKPLMEQDFSWMGDADIVP